MVQKPPSDDPLSPAQSPERYCRMCGVNPAILLPELGPGFADRRLFCSVIHAAIFGVKCVLEEEQRAS